MTRMLDAQTFGSFVVIGCFVAAEAAARCLNAYPSSDFAWYLNIEVFRSFEAARVAASPLNCLFGPHTLALATVLLFVTAIVRTMRLLFAVALMANLSFVVATSLAYTALSQRSGTQFASIVINNVSARPDVLLMLLMLASSLLSFGISHIVFLQTIHADRSAASSSEC